MKFKVGDSFYIANDNKTFRQEFRGKRGIIKRIDNSFCYYKFDDLTNKYEKDGTWYFDHTQKVILLRANRNRIERLIF